MEKTQFIEQLIHQARSIPMTTVVGSRMSLIRKGTSYKGLCPFHNGKKIGSFDVSDRKQIWKCFSCGVGGDTIKFVSLYDGIDYLAAAFRVALECGIISSWEYDEYYANRRYRKHDIEKIQRRYEAVDKEKFQNNIADNETLDQVFRIFIKACDLSETHKNHLLNERGLTEEEISKGLYFTFPTRKVLSKFCKNIRSTFDGSEEVLSTIPGFFRQESKKFPGQKMYSFAKHVGIGIGIKNAKGQIVGIQIRHDTKGDKDARYVWFSSAFAMNDDKYDSGTSSGSPVDVVYPEIIKNRTVLITEGRFKAQHLSKATGSITISVQGVTSWRGIVNELDEIPNSFAVKKRYNGDYKVHCLCIAFDADMNYKWQVAEQLKKMADQLEAHGYYTYYLNWSEEDGKGVDDIILAGKQGTIKRYDKELWDKSYEKMCESILKNEPYTKMADVPKHIVKKYFEIYVRAQTLPLKKGELSGVHQRGIKSKKTRIAI
ncbi:hypothetical protein JOD82_001682 [Paenibacillus sp. 1182]|uniref:CHC2 zinc finger domain-containing protein n=1 Tax=Paenibacillus sp. 1182 TaxID=2806565 RepID=UPI001AE4B182|nr:CHC2 zinc finger domain-containing protein [Paenibacillus sp. 1182]MBP1308662.1 hypothetical protein [Paenibacillus sp. 1182]